MSVSSTHEAYILKGRKKEQWENRHIFIEMLAILRPEKYVKPHFFQTLENRQHKIMISDRREINDHLWITSWRQFPNCRAGKENTKIACQSGEFEKTETRIQGRKSSGNFGGRVLKKMEVLDIGRVILLSFWISADLQAHEVKLHSTKKISTAKLIKCPVLPKGCEEFVPMK